MGNKIILLADDDNDDTELFHEALRDIDSTIECFCSGNGSELLESLDKMEKNPDLIFLDLNMPIMNGWQCLKALKETERYREIPVMMISTSSHQKDIDMATGLGAVCYFVKPSSFHELTEVLGVITSNLGTQLKKAIAELKKSSPRMIFC